ncbi:pilus assembly protein [Pseudomonas citronellolis]|uniref:pilus assembly protein n=1 Tax=Pseudomonas citronellolis TaxID=53408 RepID=UPI0023E38D0D|nr:PilC/PilY family type IV pilus protein [Pseudomonas citronellolis]MDF3931614.1 PilC/PilY family type IV pilus protein [Pseudomonas citronellolis]
MSSRHRISPWLHGLLGAALLAASALATASTLTLGQQPLFLTEGVAPNIFVTLDNSGSMEYGYTPDGISSYRTTRRAKSSTFNGTYYNPLVTYSAPYSVSYTSSTLTVTQLSTSFTAAYVNGFKTSKGTLNLSTGYKVSWNYDPSTTLGSTYGSNGLAENPSADFGASTTTSSSTGSATVTTGVTYSTNASSCPSSISNTSSTSTGTPTTSTSASTGGTVTSTPSTTTVTSYSNISCTKSGSKYTVKVTTTATPTTTTTVKTTDMTKSAVPAYYYLYNTALSGCTSVTTDDNCYKLVTVSSTSGTNGTDERQNFANWYSYYRIRALASQSSANIALVNLSDNTRLAWQTLAVSDSCTLNNTTCKGIDSSGYDTRLRNFSGQHRADFFKWLADIPYGGGTPLRTALTRVGSFLQTTGVNGPYAYSLGSTASPEYACRPSYHMMVTDGLWNNDSYSGIEYDNATQTLPDKISYSPMAPYKDSTGNTLADIAFKYWATDARSDIDNDVPAYTAVSSTNATTQYWNPKNDPATWQHLVNYFVGIGLGQSLTNPAWGGDTFSGDYSKLAAGTLSWPAASSDSANNVYDLWHAAINSRGEFFSADSPDQLLSAMQNIVTRISEREDSGASPALMSSPLLNADNSSDSTLYSYTPKFNSADWSGDLIKYLQNTSAGTQSQVWSAKSLLDATYSSGNSVFSSRVVKMADGTSTSTSKLKDFTWANLSSAQQTSLNLTLAATVDSLGSKRVDFLRGDRSNEGSTFRTRSSVLGDIIDSAPVLVGAPSRLASLMNATVSSTDTSYTTFKSTWAARATRIYVGANDGMLHAFDGDGKEVFTYIPSAVIGNLYKLTDASYTSKTHQYYVDGSPVTADVYYDNAWHTVLVGTLRGGGRALFALDITDPGNIKLLWEKSYSDSDYSELGFTYSRPTISLLHNGTWSVILGNGYNGTNDKAVLYLMNIKDGSLIKALTVSDGKTTANGLATPRAADINGDLVTDYVYAGDLHGNLWRFDLISPGSLTASTTASNFKVAFNGTPLYTATTSTGQVQPITSAPYLVKHTSGTGYLVEFGTGKYIETDDADPNTSTTMSLYGIWDLQTAGQSVSSTPTLSRSKLQQQTMKESSTTTSFDNNGTAVTQTVRTVSDTAVTWYDSNGNVSSYGWYLDLPATGEMVVNNLYVTAGVLIASTLTPNEDPCADGVTTWLMTLDPYTGGATDFATIDLNNDGVVDDNDRYNGSSVSGFQMTGLKGGFTVSASSSSSNDPVACGSDGCVSIGTDASQSGRQNWRNILEQE